MSAPPNVATPSAPASGRLAWLKDHPRLSAFQVLVRRELWEHRSLWAAPLFVAVLMLVSAALTHGALQIDATDSAEWLDPHTKSIVFSLAQWGLTLPHYAVMLLVLNFYLLDCLYGERKDRSILFWKSLPVSDGLTVASKAFVGCILVPFWTYAVALVTDILFTAVWDLRAVIAHSPELVVWDTVAFLKTQSLMLLGLVISILWYAPFLGLLLLASAVVRRNVLMWVTVVPLLAVIVERIAFGTHYLYSLLAYRGDGIFWSLHLESAILGSLKAAGAAEIVSIPEVFDRVTVLPAFTNIDLWTGLLFAGACGYAAARVRRYRDDT